MNNQKGFVHIFVLIIILAIVLVSGYYFYSSGKKNSDTKYISESNSTEENLVEDSSTGNNSPRTSETYTSEFLKYSIKIPTSFETNESGNDLVLSSSTDQILISRISTNFENIVDYTNDLNNKNNTKAIVSTFLTINGYDSLIRKINFRDGVQYQVKIYVDYWVYTFSTNSPELYEDMEEIAKSFEYLGEVE